MNISFLYTIYTKMTSPCIIPFYNGYLSNWHTCQFIDNEIKFMSSEQHFMYSKAMFFGDTESAKKIVASKNCFVQKRIGRGVAGFDKELWDANCENIMCNSLYLKFSQNSDLRKLLVDTKDAILVEASKRDCIWGVGLDINDDRIYDPKCWRGKNLLGKSLMNIRKRLS